ncbi:hypothetical protein D9758_010558 [Tetrapyrgos nigripes]|uniref:Uncharacterized protein n=1 Tax=Tetrapyrgos nigripes TaxID=182062 RepID=A0A8H5D5H0_9AGAR|nr:hypothetical protein D9758_010558 [Tetrapyrgos nigripes]
MFIIRDYRTFDFKEKDEVDKHYPQFYHKTDKAIPSTSNASASSTSKSSMPAQPNPPTPTSLRLRIRSLPHHPSPLSIPPSVTPSPPPVPFSTSPTSLSPSSLSTVKSGNTSNKLPTGVYGKVLYRQRNSGVFDA